MSLSRTLSLSLVGLAVVAAACSGSSATPATSATTVATTATTSSSTSTAVTTTSSTLATAPVPLGTGPGFDEFGVAHVYKTDADGGLLVQPTGAAGSNSLGVALPNASGLFPTGQTAQGNNNATWYEVDVPDLGVTGGWVHGAYLVDLPSFAAYPCATNPSDYTFGAPLAALPTPAPVTGGSVADHVYAMNHMSDAACERTVITFGWSASPLAPYDLDETGEPADNLPAGGIVDLIQEGTFPGLWNIAFTGDMTAAAGTALEILASDNGVVDAFVARDDPATGATSIDLKFGQNRAARAFWVSDPLRLVIDTIGAPTGNGMDIAAVMGLSMTTPGHLVNVEHPINWDLNAPGAVAPITVNGWARPFEAEMTVTLRHAPASGAAPGSGPLATADFTYFHGATTQSQTGISTFGVGTNDYLEMWGRFDFTIDAIAPGDYELAFEDFWTILYHEFTVAGTGTGASTVTEYGLITAMSPNGADFDVTFDPVVWEPAGVGTCGTGALCWDNPAIEADPYTMPAGSTSSVLVWDATGNIAAQAGNAADLYGYAFGTYCASNPNVCPPPPTQFSPVWIITHDGAGTILDVLNQYVP